MKRRERYRVDLLKLQTTCEANYARLMRLLPQMRQTPHMRRIAMSQGENLLGVLSLQVLEASPYTTRLRARQEYSLPWLNMPQLEVRVYHDARMAEVISAQHTRRLYARNPYPNADMLQPDEKSQLNIFLGEWLSHCLACGHETQTIFRAL